MTVYNIEYVEELAYSSDTIELIASCLQEQEALEIAASVDLVKAKHRDDEQNWVRIAIYPNGLPKHFEYDDVWHSPESRRAPKPPEPEPVAVSAGGPVAWSVRTLALSPQFGCPMMGTTAEVELAAIAVAAKEMGDDGYVRVSSRWTFPRDSNMYTPRIRFGDYEFTPLGRSADGFVQLEAIIRNDGVADRQIVQWHSTDETGKPHDPATRYIKVNSSENQEIRLTGQMSNSAGHMCLMAYAVELVSKVA